MQANEAGGSEPNPPIPTYRESGSRNNSRAGRSRSGIGQIPVSCNDDPKSCEIQSMNTLILDRIDDFR